MFWAHHSKCLVLLAHCDLMTNSKILSVTDPIVTDPIISQVTPFKPTRADSTLTLTHVCVCVYMPDSDRCRWRPGLSSFNTFMVVDSSGLLLAGVVLLSRAEEEVSIDPNLRMGMRLT